MATDPLGGSSVAVRTLAGLGSSLLAMLSFLNLTALPVGAVWLCIVGRWKLVAVSFLVALASPKIIGLITLPLFGFQIAAAKCIGERCSFVRSFFGTVLVLGGFLGYGAIFGAWNLISFIFVVRYAGEKAAVPALLLAFAVAIWPIQAMTDLRNPGVQESLCLLCSMLEMLIMSSMLLFHISDLRWYLSACIIIVLLCVSIQAWIALTTGELLAPDSAKACVSMNSRAGVTCYVSAVTTMISVVLRDH